MTPPAAVPAFRSPFFAVPDPAFAARETVLVVDGSAVLRHLVGLTLESRGYLVTCLGSAEAALSALSAGCPPDMVVINDPLPGRAGLELVRLLRTEHGYAGGIVLTVGAEGAALRENGGVDVALARPFTSLALLAALVHCRSCRRR